MMDRNWLGVLSALTAAVMWSCQPAEETPLRPANRDGMFYTVLAEARQVARDQDKLLLVDFWRPG